MLRGVPSDWKIFTLGAVMLACGFFVGDAYRGAKESERLEALMKVSEASALDSASMLLMAMKGYRPECARSMVQIRVEQSLVRAKASTVPGYVNADLEKATARAMKVLKQVDKSGLNFSDGCTVPYE